MKKATLTALTLLLLCSSHALASSSSSSGAATSSFEALDVTETVRVVVSEIRPDGQIIVRDLKKETAMLLPYDKKTRIYAQNKKEFDGRRKLAASDLKVGHQLKVTYRPGSGEIVKVKVLKSTST